MTNALTLTSILQENGLEAIHRVLKDFPHAIYSFKVLVALIEEDESLLNQVCSALIDLYQKTIQDGAIKGIEPVPKIIQMPRVGKRIETSLDRISSGDELSRVHPSNYLRQVEDPATTHANHRIVVPDPKRIA
jgi:hypothetical protein